jgi:hypothetical protein
MNVVKTIIAKTTSTPVMRMLILRIDQLNSWASEGHRTETDHA